MTSRYLTLIIYVALSTVSASIWKNNIFQEADLTFIFTSSCSDLINSEVLDVPYFHPIRRANSYTPLRHLVLCHTSRDIQLPHMLKNNLGNPNLQKSSRPHAIFIPLGKSIGPTSETYFKCERLISHSARVFRPEFIFSHTAISLDAVCYARAAELIGTAKLLLFEYCSGSFNFFIPCLTATR